MGARATFNALNQQRSRITDLSVNTNGKPLPTVLRDNCSDDLISGNVIPSDNKLRITFKRKNADLNRRLSVFRRLIHDYQTGVNRSNAGTFWNLSRGLHCSISVIIFHTLCYLLCFPFKARLTKHACTREMKSHSQRQQRPVPEREREKKISSWKAVKVRLSLDIEEPAANIRRWKKRERERRGRMDPFLDR